MTFRLSSVLLLLVASVYGCSSIPLISTSPAPPADRDRGPPPGTVDVSMIPDAVPRAEPKSRYGNPPSYVVNGKTYYTMESGRNFVERGIASWYGEKFHGRRTSSGETYDMYAMTAAHKSLPLPTYVEVTNLHNGKRIIVKVNDRGPFHGNRVIDLSYTAAAKLDILGKGTGLVEVRSIDPAGYQARSETSGQDRSFVKVTTGTGSSGYNAPGFYIQVGAYSQLINAQLMRDKLNALGNNLLQISEAVVNGNRLFRVRIGPINDVSQADRIVASLGRYGV
ncbi:MAG: septal ring lytic transglycosylase RlpA family protein, partial [Gammaproteobacteria bacterium]